MGMEPAFAELIEPDRVAGVFALIVVQLGFRSCRGNRQVARGADRIVVAVDVVPVREIRAGLGEHCAPLSDTEWVR